MSYTISIKDCKEWEKNKEVNPITGKKIKEGGPVYKRFVKECNTASSSKKEVVFHGFKNDPIKRAFESEEMKITSRINDHTILVVIEDEQILIDAEASIIKKAKQKKVPVTSRDSIEAFLKYNKKTNIPGFIGYLKEEQYDDRLKQMQDLAIRMENLLKQK